MPQSSPLRFPWIPLFVWILLFALVVFSAAMQDLAPVRMRLGMVFFWGVALTTLLTVWLALRRSRIDRGTPEDVKLEDLKHIGPTVPVLTDVRWQIALEREAWFEVWQTMGDEPKLDRFTRIVAPQIQQLFPGSAVGFYIRDKQETLVLALKVGESFAGRQSFHLEDCEAMSRGVLVDANLDAGTECSCSHHITSGPVFAACIPIVCADQFYGQLSVYHPLATIDVDGNSRSTILQKGQTLASCLALYLQGYSLKESLHQQNIRDTLTGLFNRRYMEETLFREFAEAIRRRNSIGVLMILPDQIGTIRATHGGKASDQILWEIGQRIPRYIRTEDIPCRLDEDCFCIILPGASLEISMQRAEKMRFELGGLNILFQNQPLSTTVSIGVSMFPDHSSTVHGLINMTEMAVRNAQRQGGNRIALPPVTKTVNWGVETPP